MKADVNDESYKRRYSGKGVLAFFLIAFLVPWLMLLWLRLANIDYNSETGLIVVMVSLVMPTVGVIVASIVTKSGLERIGLIPNIKGNKRWYLLAWLLPAILIISGAAVFFLLQPEFYDTGWTGIRQNLAAQNIPEDRLTTLLLMTLAKGIIADPVFNLVQTLPGEIGWRGYLLPFLSKKMGNTGAVIVSGALWGVWYAPMVAMGFLYGTDYPGYPWTGIVAMILFCTFLGMILSFFTVKVGSVVPGALIYSGIGNFVNFPAMFCKEGVNRFIGPSVYGILGASVMIVLALICLFMIYKKEKNHEGWE